MIMKAKQFLVFMTTLHDVEDELLQSYTAFKPTRTSYIDISEEEWEPYRSSIHQDFPLGNQAVGQQSDLGLKLSSLYPVLLKLVCA